MAKDDPYPAIGDYALIGDCHTAALISREGSIDWCCLPRFDGGSAFGRLLDWEHGGFCQVVPAGAGKWESSRGYLGSSLVLQTVFQTSSGEVRLTDLFLTPEQNERPWDRKLMRLIEGQRGVVELGIRVAPRFDYGQVRPWIRRHGHHLHSATGGNDSILVFCEQELHEDPGHELVGVVEVSAGDRVHLLLSYTRPELVGDDPGEPDPGSLDGECDRTIKWWQDWSKAVRLDSRDEPGARRSALVLKAMTYAPTGAIVAAPTTSLPEVVGGPRNWDYRYAWVRD